MVFSQKLDLKKTIKNNFWIILIFSAGFALRVYGLGSKSLWYDEAAIIFEAKKSFWQLFSINSEGIHPPLYRLIMHFWLYLGKGDLAARIPSLVFGLASIAAGYKTVKLIFDKKIALWSAFFIAVSPFHVYYAQEIKSYSLFFLLSLLSLYFFLDVENKEKSWIGYLVFSALMLYTHYFGFLNILAQNLFIVLYSRRHKADFIKKWLLAQAAIFLLFSPWLSVCLKHLGRVLDNFWIPPVSLGNILDAFKNFILGFYTSNLNNIFLSLLFYPIFLTGIFSLFWAGEENGPASKKGKLILLSYFLIPLIVLTVSRLARPIFLDRALIFTSFFCYIVFSLSMRVFLKKKIFFFITLIILLTVLAVSLKNYYLEENFSPTVGAGSIKKQFREAMEYINSNYRYPDKIVLSHYSSWPSLNYYCPEKIKSLLLLDNPLGRKDENDPHSQARLKQALDFRMVNTEQLGEGGTWVVCSGWTEKPFVSGALQEWMDMHRKENISKNRQFKGIEIYYFNKE